MGRKKNEAEYGAAAIGTLLYSYCTSHAASS
jgi:hypothetical protein